MAKFGDEASKEEGNLKKKIVETETQRCLL